MTLKKTTLRLVSAVTTAALLAWQLAAPVAVGATNVPQNQYNDSQTTQNIPENKDDKQDDKKNDKAFTHPPIGHQPKGSLTVTKHTKPAGHPQQFKIAVSGTGAVHGNAEQFIGDGESETFVVSQGTYTVTETLPQPWAQLSNSCVNVVVRASNLHPTCEIVNTKTATLTIKKQAAPYTHQDFTFYSDELGDFMLDDDHNQTLPSSKTFTGLLPGEYGVREALLWDWKLKDLSCTNNHYDLYWDEARVQVFLQPGDNVTCTYVNEQLNSLGGFKFEDLNGNGAWDAHEPTLEGWAITLTRPDGSTTSIQTNKDGFYTFTGLESGTYKVCETAQAGWMQTYPATNSGCHMVTLRGPGHITSCYHFGNFKQGTVQGVKFHDLNGNGLQDAGEPMLPDWNISLYTMQNTQSTLGTPAQALKTNAQGAYAFTGLAPGTYKVCETSQAGWTRTFPTGSDCHFITIGQSGQVVTASFGNKANPPQVLGATVGKGAGTLVNTGASATQSLAVGLVILGALGAVHLMGRRKYAA